MSRRGFGSRNFRRIPDGDGSSGSFGGRYSSPRYEIRSRRTSLDENGNVVYNYYTVGRDVFPGPRIRYPEPNRSIVVDRSSLSTSNVHANANADAADANNSEQQFLSMSSSSPEIRRQMHSLMVRLCAGGTNQLEGQFVEEEDSDEDEDEDENTGRSEEEIMASINTEIFESDDEENAENKKACGVCQEDYVNGVEVGKLNCEHKYHMECIKQWLMINNICPLCRRVAI